MRQVTIEGIDSGSIAQRVRARTYADGLLQARLGAVVHMDWDARETALYARVRDVSGVQHEVIVFFARRPGRRLAFWAASAPAGPGSTARTSWRRW
jgi:hypothetical protein